MGAVQLLRERIAFSETAFAELVLWQLPRPVDGCAHAFKYRLAYVVDGICVVRYDNEAGKGDHRHWNKKERAYTFHSPDRLLADFHRDISRWNHEHRHA